MIRLRTSSQEDRTLAPIRECASIISMSADTSDSMATQGQLLQQSPFGQEKPGSRQSQLPSIVVPGSSAYINPAYEQDEESIQDDLFENEDQQTREVINNLDQMFTFQENPTEENHLLSKQVVLRRNRSKKSKRKESEKEAKKPDWDRFETIPPPDEDETHKSEWVEASIRWFKIFAYVFTFMVVLIFSIFSKSIILLMTSMVGVGHTIHVCNSFNNEYLIHPPLDHDKQYIARYTADSVQRITWLWCLYFATVAPYFFTLGRSVRICYFKFCIVSKLETFLTVFCMETLHCIGLSLLLFVILPQMDATRGAMLMNSTCTIPAVVRLLVDYNSEEMNGKSLLKTEDTGERRKNFAWFNLCIQLVTIVGWTVIEIADDKLEHAYLVPISLILVSFEWWENYLEPNSMHRWFKFLDRSRKDLIRSRYFLNMILSVWKISFVLLMMISNEYVSNGEGVSKMVFTNFSSSLNERQIPVIRDKRSFESNIVLDSEKHSLYVEDTKIPIWILITHITITYVCYAFAKFTCKVCFQAISFAIPLCMTVPMSVSLLWAISNIAFEDKCQLANVFPPFQYIFWNVDRLNNVVLNTSWNNVLVMIVWFISLLTQISNTLQIWKRSTERLASTEQLFVNPMYNAALIDQSLVFNRRCYKLDMIGEDDDDQRKTSTANVEAKLIQKDSNNNDMRTSTFYRYGSEEPSEGDLDDSKFDQEDDETWKEDWIKVCRTLGIEEDSIDAKPNPEDDETIRIYICATMWHEDRNEMLQMLKAVMRLDYEQGARKIAKKHFGNEQNKLIYEMEVNIFFDDAYEQGDSDDVEDRVINRFVHQLIDVMNEAANQVMVNKIKMDDPTIVATPYGGKLIWQMPMKNRLIAHIKDKDQIRHRKRWSQCMYMYYLLGYRLAARKDISNRRKKTIMNNTFVLALDGDINFRPEAVDMVVDLMKKNSKLGAACGRIHPIGSGPIVWYQKFEYAIGHWLQKATEHVFGCVLCSPGCFSLFRARALMDDSVMNKYTTKPTEALHYVQYDQGEDRWLCTLMLQRGWRIEYCAASDSYTHAPEGFAEFYTQRRRWAPSTMANILDLLGDYKQTVKINENISYLYIIYQGMMMLGTVISPGTIFLMVVSAMNTVMGFQSETSLLCNLIPILAFIIVCLKFKDNNIKINFAMILSVIYALLMLAVLVGTGIDMYRQGFFSPNSLFFSAMMASFVVAAILHPQEFSCVIPLPIYMLLIPSMYLLLSIYSVTNMHIVAWGTREVKSKLSAKEIERLKEEEAAKAQALAAKKSNFRFMDISQYNNTNGLFTCMCCTSNPRDDSSTLHEISSQVKDMNQVITSLNSDVSLCLGKIPAKSETKSKDEQKEADEETEKSDKSESKDGDVKPEQKDNKQKDRISGSKKKPRWVLNDKRLRKFPFKPTHKLETEFWKAMIEKYLYPLDENLKDKERIQTELEDLRTKMVFAFGFMNVIFVLFVFMLQLHKDVFGIDIPVEVTYNKTYDEETESYSFEPVTKVTRMDPIGLVLVIFFGAILIIQCIGMFIHRFGTLAHLLAYTDINEKKRQFDPSKYVKEIIQSTSHKDTLLTDTDDTESSTNIEIDNSKPMEYGKFFDLQMQKLEHDQNRMNRLSKVMQKNTKRAMSMKAVNRTSFSKDRRESQTSFQSGFSIPIQMSNTGLPSEQHLEPRKSIPGDHLRPKQNRLLTKGRPESCMPSVSEPSDGNSFEMSHL